MTMRSGHACRAARVAVPHDRSSVRLARHLLAEGLAVAGVEQAEREDAVLVASELVSNAVRHAAPLPDGHIGLAWEVQDDVLHLEITDGGAQTRPVAAVARASALGGRGLDIVRRVTSRWGVTERDDSLTVWAEVPRHLPVPLPR